MTKMFMGTLAAVALLWGTSAVQAQQDRLDAQRDLQPQQQQQQPQQQFDEIRRQERIEEYRARPRIDDFRSEHQYYDDARGQQQFDDARGQQQVDDYGAQRRLRPEIDGIDRRAIQAEIDDVVSRYRWVNGTWWYVMRDGRWVYWDGFRWNEADPGAGMAGQFGQQQQYGQFGQPAQFGTGFRGGHFPQQQAAYYPTTMGWGGGWGHQGLGHPGMGWGGGWGHGGMGWGGGFGQRGPLQRAAVGGLVGAGIGGLAGGRRGVGVGAGVGAGLGALGAFR